MSKRSMNSHFSVVQNIEVKQSFSTGLQTVKKRTYQSAIAPNKYNAAFWNNSPAEKANRENNSMINVWCQEKNTMYNADKQVVWT